MDVGCCQVEVSATGQSLVQRSPTECCVSKLCRSQNLNNEADWAQARLLHRRGKNKLKFTLYSICPFNTGMFWWRWVVNFMDRLLYHHHEKNPVTTEWGWVGLRASFHVLEMKIISVLLGRKPWFLNCLVPSQVTTPSTQPWLLNLVILAYRMWTFYLWWIFEILLDPQANTEPLLCSKLQNSPLPIVLPCPTNHYKKYERAMPERSLSSRVIHAMSLATSVFSVPFVRSFKLWIGHLDTRFFSFCSLLFQQILKLYPIPA
jgi:hypothetical protein